MDQQQAAPAEGQGVGSGAPADGGMGELIGMIGNGINQLGESLQKAGAPEPIMQAASQALAAFSDLVDMLQGGKGGSEDAAEGEQGMSSMEGGPSGVPAGDPRMRG